LNRPTYAAAFRCIGPECEDHCCRDWDIPLDRATYEKYQRFPDETLGTLVSAFVALSEIGAPDSTYGVIRRLPSGHCAFFGGDRLCGVQKQYGAAMLSATCSIFPRVLNRVDGELEGSLSLSCPEAARNVLLQSDALDVAGDLESGEFRTDNVFHLGTNGEDLRYKPFQHFHAIQAMAVGLVRDRSRPLWLRVLRIGFLCQRLSAAMDDGQAMEALAMVRKALEDPRLDEELALLPIDPRTRLDVVLQLSDERAQDASSGRRFREVYWEFIEGIGVPVEETPLDGLPRLSTARNSSYAAYFERHASVLENYLMNSIYQELFPFGSEGSARSVRRSLAEEYLLLATRFAWIDTLLVGVAANRREAFGDDDVVRTVQSLTRAVEHYPYFHGWLLEFLEARGLTSLAGMAILLRE
jgi:lysine-N-methylase